MPAAQKEWDLAMAYFHSFAWELYKAPVDRAAEGRPELRYGALATRARRARQPVRLAGESIANATTSERSHH
jgi:hypothetical protein